MNKGIMCSLGGAFLLASVGCAFAANEVNAGGKSTTIRGRTYVAACPPVKASIPRTPGPQV